MEIIKDETVKKLYEGVRAQTLTDQETIEVLLAEIVVTLRDIARNITRI